MPQSDRIGITASGVGVLGIGAVAVAIGLILSPEGRGSAEAARGSAGMVIPGLPQPPADEIWFYGFRVGGVHSNAGLVRSLAQHEREGALSCTPSLKDLDRRRWEALEQVQCEGQGLSLRAQLHAEGPPSLRLQTRAGAQMIYPAQGDASRVDTAGR